MPSKNVVKIYVKDGIYHVYNRGVEKRNIFSDEQDYKVFLHFLKRYLLPLAQVGPRQEDRLRWESDIHKEIRLLCYCLMPNHFHLMIQQLEERSIIEFMKRLGNAYINYFNKKNKRVGSLFQGRYKAVLIQKESHFLYLPYYIHNNPSDLEDCDDPKNYPYSSYADYLGKRNTEWIFKKSLMEQFKEAEISKMGFGTVKNVLGKVTLE